MKNPARKSQTEGQFTNPFRFGISRNLTYRFGQYGASVIVHKPDSFLSKKDSNLFLTFGSTLVRPLPVCLFHHSYF